MIAWYAPLAPLVVVVASIVWVYADARRWVADGRPVFVRVGAFSIDTPLGWLVCCTVVWIVGFPTYLVARKA